MFKMCFRPHRTQKIYSPKKNFFFPKGDWTLFLFRGPEDSSTSPGELVACFRFLLPKYNFERELYLSLFVEEISRNSVLDFQIAPIIINHLNDCANIVQSQQKTRIISKSNSYSAF